MFYDVDLVLLLRFAAVGCSCVNDLTVVTQNPSEHLSCVFADRCSEGNWLYRC